jgi:hypothetical protein
LGTWALLFLSISVQISFCFSNRTLDLSACPVITPTVSQDEGPCRKQTLLLVQVLHDYWVTLESQVSGKLFTGMVVHGIEYLGKPLSFSNTPRMFKALFAHIPMDQCNNVWVPNS